MNSLSRTFAIALFSLLAVMPAGAQPTPDTAQAFPNRPVKLIVPFPPGGPTDLMARVYGQKLSERDARGPGRHARGSARLAPAWIGAFAVQIRRLSRLSCPLFRFPLICR